MPSAISSAGPALIALAGADGVRRVSRWMALAVTLAAMGVTIALSAAGTSRLPLLVALGHVAAVGIPVAVGLHAAPRRRDDRFGLLLIALGAGSFAATFAESPDEQLYTAGRMAGWLLEALLVYAILSFPTGRLEGRVDRALAGAMALVVVLLFLPRAVLAEDFKVLSPFTSCMARCPGNDVFGLH